MDKVLKPSNPMREIYVQFDQKGKENVGDFVKKNEAV
jgi:hypothetical protein